MNKNFSDIINHNPAVITVKKQAKLLLSQLKHRGVTLSECQNIAAQNNGYNNWHHFYHTVKNKIIDNTNLTPFIFTDEKILPDHLYLGYYRDILKHTWMTKQNPDICIFGQTPLKSKICEHFAMQSLLFGKQTVIFQDLTSTQGIASAQEIIRFARTNGTSDIHIIGFNESTITHPSFKPYVSALIPEFTGSDSMIAKTILEMVIEKHGDNPWLNRLASCLEGVALLATYLRDRFQVQLTFNIFRELLNLDTLYQYVKTQDLPKDIYKSIIAYLTLLPGFHLKAIHPATREQHNYICQWALEALDQLTNHCLYFKNNAPIIGQVLHARRNSLLLIETSGKKSFDGYLLNMVKCQLINKINSYDPINHPDRAVLDFDTNIFINDMHLPEGFSVLATQAGRGIGLCFGYNNLSALQKYAGEATSLLANIDLKIMSDLASSEEYFLQFEQSRPPELGETEFLALYKGATVNLLLPKSL